jgi:diguanylate cyclase (GGDEF)-like protein
MKVLIATNNPEYSVSLPNILTEWGFQVVIASDGISALEVLQNGDTAPVIAMIENNLPHMSGMRIIQRIRNRVDAPYQYLLLFGLNDQTEEKLFGLDAGADVCLSQPLNLLLLRMHLQSARRMMEKQLRQRVVQENLWNQANRDPLTTLPNRRAILKSLDRQAASCAQREQPLGVLMIDLDHFKQINDTFGHDGGDDVLREVSERMKVNIRTTDTVGRFGGEEFMAVIPNCAGEELLRISERIRIALNKNPVNTPSQLIPVSCSIGVAVRWDVNDGDVKETLQRADRALYVAKEMGRNRVVSAWTLHDRARKVG